MSSELGESKAESGSWREVAGLCVVQVFEFIGLNSTIGSMRSMLLFSMVQGCIHLRSNAFIYITLKQETASVGLESYIYIFFPRGKFVFTKNETLVNIYIYINIYLYIHATKKLAPDPSNAARIVFLFLQASDSTYVSFYSCTYLVSAQWVLEKHPCISTRSRF